MWRWAGLPTQPPPPPQREGPRPRPRRRRCPRASPRLPPVRLFAPPRPWMSICGTGPDPPFPSTHPSCVERSSRREQLPSAGAPPACRNALEERWRSGASRGGLEGGGGQGCAGVGGAAGCPVARGSARPRQAPQRRRVSALSARALPRAQTGQDGRLEDVFRGEEMANAQPAASPRRPEVGLLLCPRLV